MSRRTVKVTLSVILFLVFLILESSVISMNVSAAESIPNSYTDKQGIVYVFEDSDMTACVDSASKEVKADNIIIPEKIEVKGKTYKVYAIHDMAFACAAKKVTIPKTIEEVGLCAFRDCLLLENISVDSANEYYTSTDGVLFDKKKTVVICFPTAKKTTSYTIPSTVKTIDSNAFYRNQSLKSVVIPPSVEEIYWGAFADSPNLENITMTPQNFKIIGSYAFNGTKWEKNHPNNEDIYLGSIAYRCRLDIGGSENYSFKEGTTLICEDFFSEELNKIKSIYIPKSIENMSGMAFKHCPELLSFTVSEANPTFCTDGGILYNKDKSMLICYPRGKKEDKFVVPESVKQLYWHSFYNSALKEITLPNDLEQIGAYALSNSKITNITIPGSVETIGDSAFYMCSDLETVIIGRGVKEIGSYAFGFCQSYNDIIIPESVTYIGEGAFAEGKTLMSRKGSYTESYCKDNKMTFYDYIEKITKGIDEQYTNETRYGYNVRALQSLFDLLDESDRKLITNKNKLDEMITWSDFVDKHPQYRDAFFDRRLYIKAKSGVLPADVKPDAVEKQLSEEQQKGISKLTGRESNILGSFEFKLVNKNGDQVAASTDLGKTEGTYNLNADIPDSEYGDVVMIFIDPDGKITEIPITITEKEAVFEVRGSGVYALIKKGEPVKDNTSGIIIACAGGAFILLICIVIIIVIAKKKRKQKNNSCEQVENVPVPEIENVAVGSDTTN